MLFFTSNKILTAKTIGRSKLKTRKSIKPRLTFNGRESWFYNITIIKHRTLNNEGHVTSELTSATQHKKLFIVFK